MTLSAATAIETAAAPVDFVRNTVEDLTTRPRHLVPVRELTVIVPTRNEARNVEPLVERLGAALAGLDAEVLFVDDSDDDTPAVVREVAGRGEFPVRLLHRAAGSRDGGLGGAVQAGLSDTTATFVVVMDGDLQHPPETIPQLLAAAGDRELDVVVASRYNGGAADGLASPFRRFVSSSATVAARATFPRLLAAVTDPMSGFFVMRRDVVRPEQLRPRGFKILLEILARGSASRVGEVPFTFADRHAGESKASGREAVRFFRQLLVLRLVTSRAWFGKLARFALVGGSGVLVNIAVLQAALAAGRLPDAVAATVATQVAILWNFLLSEAWVFRGTRSGPRWARAGAFWLLNTAALAVQLPLAAGLSTVLGIDYVRATLLALVVLVLVRFVVCDVLLYRPAAGEGRRPAHASIGRHRRAAHPAHGHRPPAGRPAAGPAARQAAQRTVVPAPRSGRR